MQVQQHRGSVRHGPKNRSPRPRPSDAPSISPGNIGNDEFSVYPPATTPKLGCSVVKG